MIERTQRIETEAVEIRRRDDLLALGPDWSALIARAPHTLAQTFPFALTAVEIDRRHGRRSFVALARREGVLVGVMGFSLFRGFHDVLRPFSCGTHEEYCDPPLDPACAPEAAAALLRAASGIKADRLMLYNLLAGGPFDAAAKRSGLRQAAQPMQAYVIRSAKFPSWSDAEREIGAADRRDLGRRLRNLQKDWPDAPIEARWLRTPEESRAATAFVIREKRRWLAREGKQSHWLGSDHVPEFLDALVENLDLATYPALAALSVGPNIIAAAVCFQSDSTVEYCVNAYDEAFKRHSPTKLLMRFLVEDALEHRRDFDFCVTLAPYKKEWPVEIKDCVTRTIQLTRLGGVTSPREAATGVRKILSKVRNRLRKRAPSA